MKRKIKNFEKKCNNIVNESLKKSNGQISLLKLIIYILLLFIFLPLLIIYDITTAILGWLIVLPEDENKNNE